MVEQLRQHPDWKVNLEIEPETWDRERIEDPLYYNLFAEMLADSVSRIEYVNPGYAQSYLFNTSTESSIRQFSMGLDKLREHFPGIAFSSYSSEEPCFTSALPAILSSFGVRYASSKNPNTCWGGYTAAFGNRDFVTWKAADGSEVLCVPRYASEKLEDNSIWQTNAWGLSKEYVEDALQAGIAHPVGMGLQDAGWRGGSWLKGAGHYLPMEFTLWSDYFKKYGSMSRPVELADVAERYTGESGLGVSSVARDSPACADRRKLVAPGRKGGHHVAFVERYGLGKLEVERGLERLAAFAAPRLLDCAL